MEQPAPVLAPAFGTRRLAETGRRPGVRGMTTSVTALERKIEQILRDAASPCAVLDIQRKLRLIHGKVREDVVLSTLARGAVFVTPGEGRWWLKARLHELGDVAPAASPAREPAAVEDLPLLGALAKARADYVVLDVETTGTEDADHILQFVAIRHRAGIPTDMLVRYCHPAGRPVSETLMRKLGYRVRPQVWERIQQSPPFSEVAAEVATFLGTDPIVAHNARFDAGFLQRAIPEFANSVLDTQELAYLVCPELERHKLEQVCDAVGSTFPQAAALAQRLAPDDILALIDVSEDTLHDAVTDTCLLSETYRLLLQRLDALAVEAPFLPELLPELWGRSWEGEAVDAEPFLAQHAPTLPADCPPSPPVMVADGSAQAVQEALAAYRAGRGFPERAGQSQMADHVHAAMAAQAFAMIEAPTGTGKSLAYLVPAALHAMTTGERVAIATPSRTLQDQLVRDLRAFEDAAGLPVRYEVLKGLANELCRQALLHAVAALKVNSTLDERYVLAFLLRWLAAKPGADADGFPFWLRQRFPVAGHLLADLAAGQNRCGGAECQRLGCAAWRRAKRAQSAHLVLINHALWLADPDRLPDAPVLIVDEAHTLEDAATSALTRETSREALGAIFRTLVDRRTGRGVIPRLFAQGLSPRLAAGARAIEDASGVAEQLAGTLGEHVQTFVRRVSGKELDRRYGATLRLEGACARLAPTQWPALERACAQFFDVALGDLIRVVLDLAERIGAESVDEGLARAGDELRAVAEALREQQEIFHAVTEARNRKAVYWIALEVAAPGNGSANHASAAATATVRNWAFRTAPVRVDEALQALYAKLGSAIFVSATLRTGKAGFRFFRGRLGLSELVAPDREHVIASELNYGSNVLLGLPLFLNATPSQRTLVSFQQELAQEWAQFLAFTGGRALGLFTARVRMETVAGRLRPALEREQIALLAQEPGVSRQALLEEFRADEQSVLLGLKSFWEGVDVPGPALSFVLMEKLPFPALHDPVSVSRREDVLAGGGSEFTDYLFPLMCLQFTQGFGRLLRTVTDRGAVVLYDKRVQRKGYFAELLATLPGFLPRVPEQERSRRRFYEAIADHLPGLIDIEQKQAFLDALPDALLTDLEQNLERWLLPALVTETDYTAIRPVLLEVVAQVFGHAGFRSPAQERVVLEMLAGHDLLGLLPTGSGKSLCYQLTALVSPGVTVVISPLIALMRDQVSSLLERGVEIVGAMMSGQGSEEREETLLRLRRGRLKLLYVAPERLRDAALLGALSEARIARIVVDEAHCVCMWGPQFRPDFLRLQRVMARLGQRPPVAALTATATPEMRQEITTALGLREPREIVASFDRPELHFVVANRDSVDHPIRTERQRFGLLLRILQAAEQEEASSIVYVASISEAETYARRLRAMGFAARAYHGKMERSERDTVQDLFMDDQITTVVCTKAFGMGIDKRDIRYVVHAHMPGDLESYFQEAGRAGRDGQRAWCILLHHPKDRGIHEWFIERAAPSEQAIAALLDVMRRHATVAAGGDLVMELDALAEAAAVDATHLNVLLHQCEQAGVLVREDDVTARAVLTLREDPAVVCAELAGLDPAAATLLAALAAAEEWQAHQRTTLDLPALAVAHGISELALDKVLLALSAQDLALYRPFRKAAHLQPGPRLMAADASDLVAAIADPRPAMSHKLAQMEHYATAAARLRGGAPCRRAALLHYFGEAREAAPCGACDVCCPDFRYPWSALTARDVAGIADFYDPAYTLLETVQWNTQRGEQGRSMFGLRALRLALLGNGWELTRYEANPERRKGRLAALQACPFWGVLEAMEQAESRLSTVTERLQVEGFLAEREVTLPDGGHYVVPALTERALAQLRSGETLGW